MVWTGSIWLRIGTGGGFLWKNLRFPLNAGKFFSSCTTGGFSRRARLHEWVSEWVSEWVNQWVSQWVSEWVTEFAWRDKESYNRDVTLSDPSTVTGTLNLSQGLLSSQLRRTFFSS
jgi:hypothetical protein